MVLIQQVYIEGYRVRFSSDLIQGLGILAALSDSISFEIRDEFLARVSETRPPEDCPIEAMGLPPQKLVPHVRLVP